MYDDFVAKNASHWLVNTLRHLVVPEHHTGLAVDVNDDTSACRRRRWQMLTSWTNCGWLADTAPTLWFYHQYPSGAQPITGIAYEPWHLRYVGALAKLLTTSGS